MLVVNDSVSLLFAATIDPVPTSRRTIHTRRTAMGLVMVCLGRVFHKEMNGKTGREEKGWGEEEGKRRSTYKEVSVLSGPVVAAFAVFLLRC